VKSPEIEILLSALITGVLNRKDNRESILVCHTPKLPSNATAVIGRVTRYS
jgi:hypothetical protein